MNAEVKVLSPGVVHSRSRTRDYIELMKPELTSLSVLTTLCGFYLATTGSFDIWLFIHTAFGTALVGGGAGTLNQFIEREYDALMKRTERRPLPAGRMLPAEALLFGSLISVIGILELTLFVNPLTGFLATLTSITYLFLYTPLKRITPLSTVIGGIPGAIPPMMGWTAVRGTISLEAWILFAILFCWQMPHFFSLAWMYRKDYARAGFKMLTVIDEDGTRTGRQILVYCIALIPATLTTTILGFTGMLYFVSAAVFGVVFLIFAIFFTKYSGTLNTGAIAKVNYYSRRVFFASLLYLPALLILMSVDKI